MDLANYRGALCLLIVNILCTELKIMISKLSGDQSTDRMMRISTIFQSKDNPMIGVIENCFNESEGEGY